jgi:hypothetical protein
MAVPVITDTQKAELNERGYTIFPGLFTEDEMSALGERIESYQRRHAEAIAAKGGNEGISRASEITFTAHLAEHDPEIEAFARRPEFLRICGELLGPDVDLYWTSPCLKCRKGRKSSPGIRTMAILL